MFRLHGHPWGYHRVLDKSLTLPQAAAQLDVSLPIFDNEILVRVRALHLDSASWHQLKTETEDPSAEILNIVKARGKMHNPVTNSGGVLLGDIETIGPAHPKFSELQPGQTIISLVSLTLTPLQINEIKKISSKGHLDVQGLAILFASSPFALLPTDFSEATALAALDVCGAPAYVDRYVQAGDRVLILGLGKAGLSCAVRAQEIGAKILGVDACVEPVTWCQQNLRGDFTGLSAQGTMAVYDWVLKTTQGQEIDLVFNVVNQPGTEMSGITACRPKGKIIFFGMNTSFQKAVLGAEGLGKDVTMIMGNGFVAGHADAMFQLLRRNKSLRERMEKS